LRDLVQFLTELIVSLTGALAAGSLVVGGIAFAIGCAVCGCGYTLRRWRRFFAARRGPE
jgi:hypothetical protein